VRIGKPTNDLSIKARVEHYRTDLETRGQDTNNASRVLSHLAGTKLANKLVTASSLSDDLREFRDHLAAKKLKLATIDRITNVFKAALNLAADVQADFIDPRTGKRAPRLMMPTSRKGRGKKKIMHRPVPITTSLADRQKGRTGILLRRADGAPWAKNLSHHFADVVTDVNSRTRPG
jgi:hypothetical protein